MKRLMILAACCAVSFTAAAFAQEEGEADRGLSLMERGAQLFMEGILKEMEPALGDMAELGDRVGPALRDFAEQMGPALAKLLDEVEDWSLYEAPETLPNGDIIIRRKPDPPMEGPPIILLEEEPQIDI
jgi:hypothetical protein